MTEISGKTAFITGAASGLGLALAKDFARRGAKLMLVDRDGDALAAAERDIRSLGAEAASYVCDVTDVAQMRAAAAATTQRFEKVHIVVNNAGVAIGGEPGRIPLEDWRWIIDINLMGVVHGVEIFTPLIKSHGEGGHFLNTASMAGQIANPGMSPYNATKYAVVGYSEGLALELKADNIGVSILCPGWVKTKIHTTGFNRPSGLTPAEKAADDPSFQAMSATINGGLDADAVAGWTSECIEANRLYVFTHSDFAPAIGARFKRIRADYDAITEDGRFKA